MRDARSDHWGLDQLLTTLPPCSQHEYDHLEGVVYIDHLNEEDMGEVQPQLDTLAADFGEGGAVGTRPGNRQAAEL